MGKRLIPKHQHGGSFSGGIYTPPLQVSRGRLSQDAEAARIERNKQAARNSPYLGPGITRPDIYDGYQRSYMDRLGNIEVLPSDTKWDWGQPTSNQPDQADFINRQNDAYNRLRQRFAQYPGVLKELEAARNTGFGIPDYIRAERRFLNSRK